MRINKESKKPRTKVKMQLKNEAKRERVTIFALKT